MGNNDKKHEISLPEIAAIISLLIGLIIFVFFGIQLWSEYSICSGKFDMPSTGHVGDFIGGVVGAFWTLASTLFFYNALQLQRKELENSRNQMMAQIDEMKRGTKEFEIGKINNIIYKQLDLFEAKLFNLKYIEDHNPYNDPEILSIDYTGITAISSWTYSVSRYFTANFKLESFEVPQGIVFMELYDTIELHIFIEFMYTFEKSLDIFAQIVKARSTDIIDIKDIADIKILIQNNFYLDYLIKYYEKYIWMQERLLNYYESLNNPEFKNRMNKYKNRIEIASNTLALMKKFNKRFLE